MPPTTKADEDQTDETEDESTKDESEETSTEETKPDGTETGKLELTQDELDRIVLQRTEQARRKATEAADKAKKWDEYEASQKTDAEKAATLLAEAEKEAKAKIDGANQRLIKAEVRQVAAEKGVRKDAVDLVVQLLAGDESILVEDDGRVEGADAAVAALIKKHEYLTDKKSAPKSGSGSFSGNDGKTDSQKIKEAQEAKDPKESIRLKMQGLVGS